MASFLANHRADAGDIIASLGSSFVVVSHWSEVLTPIVTLLVGLLTAAWWAVRLWDRFSVSSKGDGTP